MTHFTPSLSHSNKNSKGTAQKGQQSYEPRESTVKSIMNFSRSLDVHYSHELRKKTELVLN